MRILNQSVVCAILCGGAALLISAAAHAQVFSEDFSGGNPAQTSEYTLINAGGTTQPGQYRIVNNPATAFTSGFTSYFDHTLGTSAGAMLFFDGSAPVVGPSGFGPAAAVPNIYVRSGVNLTVGTQYTFSFWGSAGVTTNVPVLSVLIDGFGVPAANLVTVNGTWTQFSTTYTPTNSGPHTFAIYDVTNIPGGNDGAIDDVRLAVSPAAVGPEPSSLALLLPFASGGAAVAARLRRRKNAS